MITMPLLFQVGRLFRWPFGELRALYALINLDRALAVSVEVLIGT